MFKKSGLRPNCKLKEFRLEGFFSDPGVSATIPLHRRPRGELLCNQTRPGDQIVVARFDRAFRSLVDTAAQCKDWLNHGMTCYFVEWGIDSSQPFWRMFGTLVAIDAERAREMITARTQASVQERKRTGRR